MQLLSRKSHIHFAYLDGHLLKRGPMLHAAILSVGIAKCLGNNAADSSGALQFFHLPNIAAL